MGSIDRDVLVGLFRSTGGANWRVKTNWDTKDSLSTWHGVEVNELGCVVGLTLVSNKLKGSIPPQLGSLEALRKLDLQGNLLSGSIPPELGNLSALRKLDLSRNLLSGPIPKKLGALSELERLWLQENKLTGSIPKELRALHKLEMLSLAINRLTGSIPPELGYLGALEALHLSSNGLSGPIPNALGALSKLQTLWLTNNQLSGSIPEALGALTKLSRLYLNNNQLTAMWDHSQGGVRGEELQQGCAAGCAIPKALEKLLALFSRLDKSVDHHLEISKNPWEEPPEAVLKKGIPAVSEYFADLFAEGITIRRSMIKVVLVGQEGAGKTSLRQSIRTGQPTPTCGSEESTVQIDVEEMDVDGVSLRVYDCAGQVAYTGLLQMFLSPRAVSLLVCNIGAFGQRDGCSSDKDQLNRDLAKLQELRVCDWLRSLSFRIPDSDVVVVATKCDKAGGNTADLAKRIEHAVRMWQHNWSGSEMPAVRVGEGVSLTSCVAAEEEGGAASRKRKHDGETMCWACDWPEDMRDDSPPSLIRRIMYNGQGDLRGEAMVLPGSWNIALKVLEALGSGRDAVESVFQMQLKGEAPGGGKRLASTTTKQPKGRAGITQVELSAKWHDVVDALKRDGVTVANPDHALEGALSIREHQGSLVRHETYVFLDVTWLAKILKPLLNHRDDEDPFCGNVALGDTGILLEDEDHIASWKRLKDNGVLEPSLAQVLWPDGLSNYVLPTLDSLGLTYPLDDDAADGLVVLLRLGMERPKGVGRELDDFRRDHTAVLSVTWKVFMGVPPGAIEKVLTRCCRIGALRTFWRFGVLVQGGFGAAAAVKTFVLLIEYSHDTNEIDMKVYGNIGTAAPWAALSLGISAVRTVCLDFPGLRWRACLKCPEHGEEMQISSKATRPGHKLLRGKTCSLCSSETGGLGAAATELLEMIDVLQSRGDIFQSTHGRFAMLQNKYPVLRPEVSRDLHPEQTQRRFDEWLCGMKQEIEGLLHGAKESSEEGEKLQQLFGGLQQQLGQQHRDVREWLEALGDKRLADVIDADDGVMGRLDFVVAMLMAMRKEGSDTPRRACVLPPWKFAKTHGLSEDEQRPEVWVRRLDEWREEDFNEGKGLFKKKKRLFLVCAHTHRLVACGPNGQGYDIEQPRTWLRMSMKLATFALQVMCTTLSAMAIAPLSGAGAAVEATVSAAVGNFESMLHNQLAGLTLDDDAAAVGVRYDDGADVDVAPQTTQLEGIVYTSLREFVHGVEDIARLEIFKATKKAHRERRAPPSSSEFVFFAQVMTLVQSREGDADVQWVLMGQEDAWYDANRRAPMT